MRLLAALGFISTLLLPACSSDNNSASTLLETARFEERQFNREHALRLYNEIIARYPDTPAAREADQRRHNLTPPPK